MHQSFQKIMSNNGALYSYDAFISYRRMDGAGIARWLRGNLQDYVLPQNIRKGNKKLRIYIDTAFERANEDFWANNIEPALRSSRYLVVVATPKARLRRMDGSQNWVEREIELFLSLPQGRNVVVVRAKGEFEDQLPGGLNERFPQISIVDMRAFSVGLDRLYLRPQMRDPLLTMLGTLHNVEAQRMPELRMEDARRARRKATRFATLVMALLVVISGLAIVALIQRNNAQAERNRAQAESRRADLQEQEARRESALAKQNAESAKQQKSIAEENALIAERNAREARARELAAYANQSLDEDPERSLLLAIHAVESMVKLGEPPLPSAEDALHNAISSSRVLFTMHFPPAFSRGGGNEADSVTFSPDGKRLAIGTFLNDVQLWDASTGQQLTTFQGRSLPGKRLVYSPDGRNLVITGVRPEFFDAVTGRKIGSVSVSGSEISDVAFSSDGKRFAAGVRDGTVKMWDRRNGRELLTLRGHSSTVYSVAFSPDNKLVATASKDRTARVWDAATGQQLLTLDTFPVGRAQSLAFSPDSSRLAAVGSAGIIRVWDATSGQEVLALQGHGQDVMAVAFSPDGRKIASAGADRTARIWDVASGQETMTLRGHSNSVASVAFSPDGKRLATASWDGTARVWDIARGESLVLQGHTDSVSGLAYSPDGKRLATASADATTRIWNSATGQELLILRGRKRQFNSVVFSPDGKRLATAGESNATVWDSATTQELFSVNEVSDSWGAVALSPDGKKLATHGPLGPQATAALWDLASQKKLFTLDFPDLVQVLTFSPDGRHIAAGGTSSATRMWDARDGRELFTRRGEAEYVQAVAFSPDGDRLAVTDGSTVAILDGIRGKNVMTLHGHTNSVRAIAYSPDGKRLATGSADHTTKLWDTATGKELMTLRGHSQDVNSVAFSPDRKHLATGGADGIVQVYDLDIHDLLKLAHTRVTRGYTQAECARYFPSEKCPAAP
jgi:WD40 repeat protein